MQTHPVTYPEDLLAELRAEGHDLSFRLFREWVSLGIVLRPEVGGGEGNRSHYTSENAAKAKEQLLAIIGARKNGATPRTVISAKENPEKFMEAMKTLVNSYSPGSFLETNVRK